MHRGSLATCGSSLELKEEFGAGYVLTMILRDQPGASTLDQASAKVVEAVKRIIPDAEAGQGAGSELSIRINKKHTDLFPELTEECERLEQDGVIRSYGLSFTTLEDVFLKVVADCAVIPSLHRLGTGVAGVHKFILTLNHYIKSFVKLRASETLSR